MNRFFLAQDATNSGDDITGQVSDATREAVESVTNWWESDLAREWLFNKPILIIVTLLIASIAHWALRRLIDRLAESKFTKVTQKLSPRKNGDDTAQPEYDPLAETQAKRRQSRIRTLAGVSKSAVGIFIWVMAGLSILSTIGVNIAPLIASAGVVGVALGFGAQSLVKDFLSGIFMLIEDQYGVGDTIDVGEDIVGDVEDISLRITTIRDIDGTLWYIRNGEILRVGNFSDQYAIARLQIPVGLSNDPEKTERVLLESAQKAAQDPAIRHSVLGKPEVNGVTEFNPDSLSYRISVTTLPADQWTVQRFMYGRILADMQDNGITVPYPHGIGITTGEDQA